MCSRITGFGSNFSPSLAAFSCAKVRAGVNADNKKTPKTSSSVNIFDFKTEFLIISIKFFTLNFGCASYATNQKLQRQYLRNIYKKSRTQKQACLRGFFA